MEECSPSLGLLLLLAEHTFAQGDEPALRDGFRDEPVRAAASLDQRPKDACRSVTAALDAWGDVLPDAAEDEFRSVRPDEDAGKSAALVLAGQELVLVARPPPLAAEPGLCIPDAGRSAA